MKKNYLKPESTVVNISLTSLLSTSDPNVKIGTGSVDADKIESRRGGFWDDDED